MRPFQASAVAEASALPAGARRLYCAPTGSGKGTIILALAARLREHGQTAVVVTPSLEIVRGLLARSGVVHLNGAGEAALWREAESRGLYTPTRLRNRLVSGAVARPHVIIVDEGHHSVESNTVSGDLVALLGDACTWVGYTATPYRGSHAGTEALRAFWGPPQVLLTTADAVSAGYMSIPAPELAPIFDDGAIRIGSAGEYDAEDAHRVFAEIDQRGSSPLVRLADLIAARAPGGVWARPTLIAVPTGDSRAALVAVLAARGIRAVEVAAETPALEREAAYLACERREAALVSIAVLGEGVDLPWLRTLIDARPLRSPVAWMQLLGRITRPVGADEEPPEYVCVTRSLERHAHLMAGHWPARRLAVATQQAFGSPGGGGGIRASIASDALKGRQIAMVPLSGGGWAEMVHLGLAESTPEGWRSSEVLVLAVPGETAPRVFRRENPAGEWGRWIIAPLPAGGCKGWGRPGAGKPVSEKQAAWWGRAAAGVGLDPAAEPDRRVFAALPALLDTRTTLAPGSPGLGAARTQVPVPPAPAESRAAPNQPGASSGLPEAWTPRTPAEPSAWSAPTPAMEQATGWVALRGDRDTYAVREALRAIGCRWDGAGRVWLSPADRLAEAEALAPLRAPESEVPTVPEGRYAVGDPLRFYRVQHGRGTWAGRTFVEVQAGDDLHPVRDPDTRTAILAAIAADVEGALRRYGREIGVCGCCGRTLTNEESRTRGIGPVCWAKWG